MPSTQLSRDDREDNFVRIPIVSTFFALLGSHLIVLFEIVKNFLFPSDVTKERNREGYTPLYSSTDRIVHIGHRRNKNTRSIGSNPSNLVAVKDFISKDNFETFKSPGSSTIFSNFASYNYLGFADNTGPCVDAAIDSIRKFGIATSSSRREFGE